jgi:hypothetical protein
MFFVGVSTPFTWPPSIVRTGLGSVSLQAIKKRDKNSDSEKHKFFFIQLVCFFKVYNHFLLEEIPIILRFAENRKN